MLKFKALKVSSWVLRARLQCCHKPHLKTFTSPQEFGHCPGRFYARQPGHAALFDGFDGDLLPFAGFAVGMFLINVCDDALGEQRYDAGGAEFSGFLND